MIIDSDEFGFAAPGKRRSQLFMDIDVATSVLLVKGSVIDVEVKLRQ